MSLSLKQANLFYDLPVLNFLDLVSSHGRASVDIQTQSDEARLSITQDSKPFVETSIGFLLPVLPFNNQVVIRMSG